MQTGMICLQSAGFITRSRRPIFFFLPPGNRCLLLFDTALFFIRALQRFQADLEQLCYVFSGSDFTLDILCVGNNPQKIQVYGAVLSLYVDRLVKLVNKRESLRAV
jgi:hypothetical protein